MDAIERRFHAAGLDCKVLDAPLGRGDERIFQLDIQRANKAQRYGVWRGDGANRAEVVGLDRPLRQLVLFVEEPQRSFEQVIRVYNQQDRLRRLEAARQAGGRVVLEDERQLVIELQTRAAKRHLLLGMDESHLFIAQLPRPASSVHQAHQVLRPEVVAGKKDVIRQGEWFFVPANARELLLLGQGRIDRNRDLGSAGRPHLCDEVVRLVDGKEQLLFARGRVRHVEHRTLELRQWMRVHKNTEVRNDFRDLGISWID